MDGTDEAISELRDQLRRYPVDRYPIQHATAQFHLGVALLQGGAVDAAVSVLRAAAQGFAPLPIEHAKATNMLGVALRAGGRPAAAADAFSRAAEAFAAHAQLREEGAARFNLGLVQRDGGQHEAAAASFEAASRQFRELRLPAQSAAAGRELGATLLSAGDLAAAVAVLQDAIDEAAKAGDEAGLGAAANALGLAHLGLERHADAVETFQQTVAANPRSVRAEGYAMAKANLALAYEQAGDAPRARLAAGQARAMAQAPPPVVAQACGVLERLGASSDDLLVVLDGEPVARWGGIVREEVIRWAEAQPDERRGQLRGWVDGVLCRRRRAAELAEAWLGVLLELPPPQMEAMIEATLQVLRERDPAERDTFRRDVTRAMASFGVPQWLRLKDTFNRLASAAGGGPAWG